MEIKTRVQSVMQSVAYIGPSVWLSSASECSSYRWGGSEGAAGTTIVAQNGGGDFYIAGFLYMGLLFLVSHRGFVFFGLRGIFIASCTFL